MKKLVLTTLAACVSMAFASAYAESTTSKEPIRLAQAPAGVSDAAPSGASPEAKRQRPKRAPKETSSRVKTPTGVDEASPSGTSPTATTQRPKREPKEGAKRSDGTPRVKDPKSVDEATPAGATTPGGTTRSGTKTSKESKDMAPPAK